MEYVRVRKTDLARNTSQIIRNVLHGQPTVIEIMDNRKSPLSM